MSDNTTTLIGRLGGDVELRFTTGGRANASFSLAVDRRYQKDGEWVAETSWLRVVAWGALAENAAASLTKGARVIVTGRLEQRSYETKEGEKRSVVEVVADDLGPSLKWARAEVERIERESGGTSVVEARRGNRAPDPVYGDEAEIPF